MKSLEIQPTIEVLRGETLKSFAEISLAGLSKFAWGSRLLEFYAYGLSGRLEDPAMHSEMAGLKFESPVLFGAGWDKKGRAIKGLHDLGFASGEVGTVLPFPQTGNDKPRLWTIDRHHRVGLNRLGFNSDGEESVEANLARHSELPFALGINVGKNKLLPNEFAYWSHAEVIRRLYRFGSFFVLGVSSPNTQDLRQLQDKSFLRENIQAAHKAMEACGGRKPLLIKVDAERTSSQYDDMIEVVVEEKAAGFVATNTYMGSDLKAAYGPRWANEAGGLSGDDPRYRQLATKVVRYLYEQAGDQYDIIGAGGVKDGETALEKIKAGAKLVEVVTAIRPTWGRVAAKTTSGLLEHLHREGIGNVQELVGSDTKRGVTTRKNANPL